MKNKIPPFFKNNFYLALLTVLILFCVLGCTTVETYIKTMHTPQKSSFENDYVTLCRTNGSAKECMIVRKDIMAEELRRVFSLYY